jgi:hypothetical protein
MTRRNVIQSSGSLVWMLVAIAVVGCSNGGSSSVRTSESSSGGGNSTPQTTVSTYVSKGPVSGASCNLFNASKNLLAGPVQSTAGRAVFSNVSLPSTGNSIIFAECFGGNYTDEATGNARQAPSMKGAISVLPMATAAQIVITPLTEIAFRKSSTDLSDFVNRAEDVATAMGIGSVDITRVVPTDLNNTVAGNDASGAYGVALAAISQAVKDQSLGTSVSGVMTTLTNKISGDSLPSTESYQLLAALDNLSQSSIKNKGNLPEEATSEQSTNLAGELTAPYVFSSSISASPAAPLVYGTNVTFTGKGRNLVQGDITSSLGSVSNCSTAIITGGTAFSVSCRVPSSGTSTIFKLITASGDLTGASATYTLTATSASAGAAAALAEVLPVSVNYGKLQKFNACGSNIPATATATLSGSACTSVSYDGTINPCREGDASKYTFSCQTPTATATTGEFALNVGQTFPLSKTINFTSGATITSVSPQPEPGSNAPSNWTVNGTGLHTNLALSFDGVACTSSGTPNGDGTQLTGVNCSNITVPSNKGSAKLTATFGSKVAELNLSWTFWDTVNPTASQYAASNEYTLIGTGFENGVTATLGGRACTPGTSQTASRLIFSCTATGDRSVTSENLLLTLPNTTRTISKAITNSPLSVVLTGASPEQINHSRSGSSSWTISGTGLYRDTTQNTGLTFAFNGVNCQGNGTVNATGTTISGVDCSNATAVSTGDSSSLTATGSRIATSGNTLTLSIKAANIATVNPSSMEYNATKTFTVTGVNFPSGITAKLGTRDCSVAGTGQTSTSLSFSCSAGNDRSISSADLTLTLPDTSTLSSTITFEAPVVRIDSTDPNNITQGQAGPSAWTVNGVGFHSGLVFALSSSANTCITSSVNTAGTVAVINCSSRNAPTSGSITDLMITNSGLPSGSVASKSITLNSLPTATFTWADGQSKTLKINGKTLTTSASVSNCSGSVVTYSLTTSPASNVATMTSTNPGGGGSFTLTTGSVTGTATVTASATAVSGVCNAATSTYVLTVSALDPVAFSFANSSHTMSLSDSTRTYNQAPTSTTPTSGVTYTYTVESQSPSGIATVNASTGEVTVSGAGTATIKATGTATDYASNTATYTITVTKGSVVLTAPTTLTQTVKMGATAQNPYTVVPTAGSSSTPTVSGGPTYSSGNTNIVTVSTTGTVTPVAPGNTTITVSYAESTNHLAATTVSYGITVTRGDATSVEVAWTKTPASPMVYGDTQMIAARALPVSVSGVTGPTPTGQICIKSSDSTILTINNTTEACVAQSTEVTLKASKASTTGATITATYQQDNNYAGGSKVEKVVTVNKFDSTIALSGLPSPANIYKGQTITMKATVTGATTGAVPTGNVTFSFSPAVTGLSGCSSSVAVNASGEATCTLTAANTLVATSNIVITAQYNGDSHYNSKSTTDNSLSSIAQADSSNATETWYEGSSTVTSLTVTNGVSKTFKLRITAPSGITNIPTGDITLTTNSNLSFTAGTISPKSGASGNYYNEWEVQMSGQITGTTTLSVSYPGDSNFTAKTLTISVTVAP